MAISTDDLRASLEAHNAEFEALLRLIPAKYYLVSEDSGEFTSKYQKNSKKQKAPKQAIKEASKKAKRDKLDPANNKTIVELQEEAAALKRKSVPAPNGVSKKKGKAREVNDEDNERGSDAGSDVEDVELEMDRMGIDENDDNDRIDDNEPEDKTGNSANAVQFKPMDAPTSIETLRAKLRKRMEELRQKNGRNKSASLPNSNGDPGSKDELLEERRKQRAALREKRRKETKEKKRREEEERKKKGKEKDRGQATSGQTTKTQLLVPDPTHPSTSQPSQNPTTNITFSTLSGSTPHTPKLLKPLNSSNPSHALTHLQSHLSSLSSLPKEKQHSALTKEQYQKAQARLEGVKVHDDPSRLAKAVKRREKEKEKSKKEWEKRKEEVEKAQAARQKKRTDNIAMRHERKKSGGKGKGKEKGKEGKRRPGFEGKGFGGAKAAASSKGKAKK